MTLAPVTRIDVQPWMQDPHTLSVLAPLQGEGRAARFVGGCVRDAVIGRPVHDIDIATEWRPQEVISRLAAAGVHVVPTGIAHGTVTAVVARRPYEITTLRVDVESHGRHATVAFSDDWSGDARRRDFTMNAMYLDSDGSLYDPTDGLPDLHRGLVRFVGDARRRIDEDVLRLLRFFRFHSHYGRGAPDGQAVEACRAMVDRLPALSGERVRAELLRLLLAGDPLPALTLMADIGVFRHLPLAAEVTPATGRLFAIERAHDGPDALRRLAAIMRPQPAAVRDVASRLRLANAERERLVALTSPGGEVRQPPTDAADGRRLVFALGDHAADRIMLGWARYGEVGAPAWIDLWRLARRWKRPDLPVGGADVIARGIPAGPQVGARLAALERWWADSDFAPERDAVLVRLDALIGGGATGEAGSDPDTPQ
ncbi:MAG: CCA tRNA nucleotidyltransferase [Alphaproteobacteria bacterium]